jgi:rod shape-determining protein MreC
MGVVGPDGVVGIVRDVGVRTCRAFSVLHRGTFIPARLKRSRDQGRVIWKGADPAFAYMIDIGQHVKVQKGDTVITSGFSTAFPADVVIGRVESSTTTQGSGFLEIKIRLSTDFNRLENVYVVQNLLSREQLTLEGQSQ